MEMIQQAPILVTQEQWEEIPNYRKKFVGEKLCLILIDTIAHCYRLGEVEIVVDDNRIIDGSVIKRQWRDENYIEQAETQDGRFFWLYVEDDVNYSEWRPAK